MAIKQVNKGATETQHNQALGNTRTLAGYVVSGVVAALISYPAWGHDLTFGSESTANFVCSDAVNWQTVRSAALGIFPHAHGCVITGAADLSNPAGNAADSLYHMTVSLDNVNPVLDNSAARTVELRDQGGVDDPNVWPVATTSRVVAGANAAHTFRLQCRKNSAGNTNLTITDSSLTVVCIQQ